MISFKINIGQPTTTPIVVRSVQVISFRIDVNSVNLEINQIKSVADKIIEELFEAAAGVISKYCVGVS